MLGLGPDCCTIQLFIILINSVFLAMSLTVITTIVLLKYTDVFDISSKLGLIQVMIESTNIEDPTVELMLISAYCVVFSLLGIWGFYIFNNKFILIIYEICIIWILISMFKELMMIIFSYWIIETEFRKEFHTLLRILKILKYYIRVCNSYTNDYYYEVTIITRRVINRWSLNLS
jgi:hypothetical protein